MPIKKSLDDYKMALQACISFEKTPTHMHNHPITGEPMSAYEAYRYLDFTFDPISEEEAKILAKEFPFSWEEIYKGLSSSKTLMESTFQISLTNGSKICSVKNPDDPIRGKTKWLGLF